jgi:hypothetical protein
MEEPEMGIVKWLKHKRERVAEALKRTVEAAKRAFSDGYRRPALFPGRGEMGGGGDLVIGIILLAVAVVISVTLISPQITALVAAEAITGIDTSAAALLPVGQLVVVVVFGIGVAVGGLAFIFKAAAKLM